MNICYLECDLMFLAIYWDNKAFFALDLYAFHGHFYVLQVFKSKWKDRLRLFYYPYPM